ncbi:type I restriction endonuclease subunit R [Marinifilum flexuosum]|uniref:type I restriction endonuclease subunit R n=1 Tax=Marinifilum flexuosum TaxID=1117708 RepID=UPI002493E069|nr:type I restriction endonuclease [Marinifilum flexuosum]
MTQSPEYTHSEKPALDLFKKLGYTYSPASAIPEREDITQVILQDRLREAIQRINPWINEINLEKAFHKITSVAGNSLMEINQGIWKLLEGRSYSEKQILNGEESWHPVHFIDYQKLENNEFLVVNQMKFHGRLKNSIPDIMVYVNGLPLAVIECKSPTALDAFDSAYGDLKYYQEYSEKVFHYNQLCVGMWEVGARYAAIGAPQKFYLPFRQKKEDQFPDDLKTEQDRLIYALFEKKRFLDLIRNFVLFEVEEGITIKKLPRHQQVRATNKTLKRLENDEGGVVWHTQGSGKSLTMAYITRKLRAQENGFENPTVIVMTDRKDLDTQITNTFRNVGFKNVAQAGSVSHLDSLLRNDYGGIVTTTLQKFQEKEDEETTVQDHTQEEEQDDIRIVKNIEGKILTKITQRKENGRWIEQERKVIELEELSTKKNIYVLVDEAHRSHYGFLASFMRTVLPHAKFVAFTGTPISKEDKSTLAEFYGGEYIDVYTINESVADEATVELRYDEGIAQLNIRKEELDAEFEEKFGHLSEEKKDKLKNEALRKYQFSKERIEQISKHIIDHYCDKIFPDKHKAMIVCSGRRGALKYKQEIDRLHEEGYHNFQSKAIVTIGSPKNDLIAREHYEIIDWNKKHPDNPKPLLLVPSNDIETAQKDYKLPFGDEKDLAKSGKKQYDNTALLIVSDMLLTGYDAPIASCMYLDKSLREHGLLQAITRVNRSRKGKNAGYIIDYNGITANLLQALEIFSGDVKPDDILKNINEELPRLEAHHAKLLDFFKPIRIDRKYRRADFMDAAFRLLEAIDKRDRFKILLKNFNKSINIVLPDKRALKYQEDFKLFNEIKLRARNIFPDDQSLKISEDESKMLQEMIDKHLKAEGVENLLQEPVSIIDKEKFKEALLDASPATKELKMRNNLKYTIKVGLDKNPDFYKPLAQRLEELLKRRREERITQLDLLKEYAKMMDNISENEAESTRKGFITDREKVVYDSMKTIFNGGAEDAANTIFELVKGELNIVDWESKNRVQIDMKKKIRNFLSVMMTREEARLKSEELVNLMIKNKG